ncbi:MAG TPA: nuclear transport factor 2 family protein [Burkholderiaceae bacterium]|jgi:ketosteroid isomerase-like protein
MRSIFVGSTLLLASLLAHAVDTRIDPGIAKFNQALTDATTRMDNAAAMALWDDDGISLLPGTAPIVGKKAISEFMDGVTKQLVGAHMQHFEMQCRDIAVSGNWATEWCHEHQIVELGGGKPPFDGQGNMLLVLHRDGQGHWRLKREMWNQAPDRP